MNNNWQAAEDSFKKGDYLCALRGFLHIDAQGMTCVQEEGYEQGFREIATHDAKRDRQQDLLLLSRNGEFSIKLLLNVDNKKPITVAGPRAKCISFCALEPDTKSENHAQVLLMEENSNGDTEICRYHVELTGRAYKLNRRQSLKYTGNADILDVTFLGKIIFVSNAKGEIYQYNGIQLKFEKSYPSSFSAQKLIVCSGEESYFLGIGRFEGLCQYQLKERELKPILFAENQKFCCAAIADVRDIGTPDIVACTRGGGIFIFDSDSLELIEQASVADEILSLFCLDVNNNGRVEILLGGATNNLHLYGMNAEHQLIKLRTWSMPHRVTHLAGMKRDFGLGSGDALVIGLGNGKIQIYAFPTHRIISMKIVEAYRHFKEQKKQWKKKLLTEKDPILLAYALTHLSKKMSCAEIQTFLGRVDREDAALLSVLPKLKVFLTNNLEDGEITTVVTTFIDSLVTSVRNMKTCKAIASSLSEIDQEPGIGTVQTHELLLQIQQQLDRIKVFKPRRQERIEKLITVEEYEKAEDRLGVLKEQGIDLLETFASKNGIRSLCYSEERHQMLYATTTGTLGILDEDLEPVLLPINIQSIEVLCFTLRRKSSSYLIFDGCDAVVFDENLKETDRLEHKEEIRTAHLLKYASDLRWIAGSDDYLFIIGPKKEITKIYVPTPVAKVIASPYSGDKGQPINVITVTGDLYRLNYYRASKDKTKASNKPQLEFLDKIGNDINVLDVDITTSDEIVVIGAHEIVLIENKSDKISQQYIKVQQTLTCMAQTIGMGKTANQLIVGTRDKSLIFFDAELQQNRETFLDDIPRSLCCIGGPKASEYLVIGFTRGNIRKYRLITDDDILKLRYQCDQAYRWQNQWLELSFSEQLVLLSVAAQNSQTGLTFDHICHGLDPKVRCIVSEETIFYAVQSLLKEGMLTVEGGSLYSLSLLSIGARTTLSQTDPYKVIRFHTAEILDSWPLAELARIDDTLKELGEPLWLPVTFGIDSVRWHRAVAFSRLRLALEDTESDSSKTSPFAYLDAFANQIQSVLKKFPEVKDSLHCPHQMEIPGIVFIAFDRILILSANHVDPGSTSTAIENLINLTESRIALIISGDGASHLKGTFGDVSADIAVIDDRDMKAISLAKSPKELFLDTLIGKIDIASLSPFQTAGPVRNTFYGREKERHTIFNSFRLPGARCCAIVGPRRIGKTSLMLKLKDELTGVSGYETLFLDLMPYGDNIDQLYHAILNKLDISVEKIDIVDFVKILGRYQVDNKARLVLFLDEVDSFLNTDKRNDFIFFKTLRAVINEAGVKVVIAGYQVLYFEMQNDQSPLFNMLEKIKLGSLKDSEGFELIATSLNYVYDLDKRQINKILEKTGCYPNFIQFFCDQLVRLKGLQCDRKIVAADINKVTRSNELHEHMVQVYLSNLDDSMHALLFLLMETYDPNLEVFVLDRLKHDQARTGNYAQKQHSKLQIGKAFTPYDLHRLLELHDIRLDPKQLDVLMTRFMLANIFRLQDKKQKSYCFTLPDLPTILKTNYEITEIATSHSEKIHQLFSNLTTFTID